MIKVNEVKGIVRVNHAPWSPNSDGRGGYIVKRVDGKVLVDACGFGSMTSRLVYLDSLEMDLLKAQRQAFFLMHRDEYGIWVH